MIFFFLEKETFFPGIMIRSCRNKRKIRRENNKVVLEERQIYGNLQSRRGEGVFGQFSAADFYAAASDLFLGYMLLFHTTLFRKDRRNVTIELKSTGLAEAGNARNISEGFPRVHIRWMVRRDLDEALEIERQRSGRVWTREDFLSSVRRRNSVGVVAELQGRVVGFMIYELRKNRIRLLNLGTLSAVRCQTVGRQLIAKLIGKLRPGGRSRISCKVHERNLAAQLFFQKLKFFADDILRGDSPETQDDSYLMQYRLTETADRRVRKPVRRIGTKRRIKEKK